MEFLQSHYSDRNRFSILKYYSNPILIIYKETFIDNYNRLSITSHYRQRVLGARQAPTCQPFEKKKKINKNLIKFLLEINGYCKINGQNTYDNVCLL